MLFGTIARANASDDSPLKYFGYRGCRNGYGRLVLVVEIASNCNSNYCNKNECSVHSKVRVASGEWASFV